MKTEICEAVEKDLGRNEFQTWLMEVGLNIATAKHTIKNLKSWMKDEKLNSELLFAPCSTVVRYEPLGVAAIFGSWNFPISTTLKPLIDAIAAGNCCLLKPSEISEHTMVATKKLVDAYMDNDAIKCCIGPIDVAIAVNKLPLDLICFTGSTRVGKIIAATAAQNLTPCILELGGKCPMVVDVSADMGHAVAKATVGKFTNSGQICIAPDYILVHEKRLKEFVEGVKVKIKEVFGEKPDGSDDMGKMINSFHTERMERIIKTSGGKILCGGNVKKEIKYCEPTLILEPDKESELMKDEIFGPVLPIYPYRDVGQALKMINSHGKPLTVYYFGERGTITQRRLVEETSSGHFVANEVALHFFSQYLGFGGVGASGSGRHGGFEGFKNFSNRKGMTLKKPAPAAVNKYLAPPYSES